MNSKEKLEWLYKYFDEESLNADIIRYQLEKKVNVDEAIEYFYFDASEDL
jgi:hypothetical protein